MATEEETEDFIAHFGVKGMKWGVTKGDSGSSSSSSSSGGSVKTRKELRGLDKASRKNDKVARNASIDAARDRVKNTASGELKAAKAAYKAERMVIGKREARKALNKVRDDQLKDYKLANETKHGREFVTTLLIGAAASLVLDSR